MGKKNMVIFIDEYIESPAPNTSRTLFLSLTTLNGKKCSEMAPAYNYTGSTIRKLLGIFQVFSAAVE